MIDLQEKEPELSPREYQNIYYFFEKLDSLLFYCRYESNEFGMIKLTGKEYNIVKQALGIVYKAESFK